jgi:predicted dehydrogenase
VYIPLPNHLHVPWSIKALAAGKHVLCEKPIALNVTEAETLLKVAKEHPDRKIMEAFMYRFHPQWQTSRQLVREGRIGDIRAIHSVFSYFKDDPDDIRNQPGIGGGALMDIGCYNISLSRWLFDAEPARVCGVIETDPRLGIDRLTSGILDFGTGVSLFTCATQMVPYQRVQVFGTQGRIEIEIPFNAPSERPCRIWLQSQGNIQEITLNPCDQFNEEIEQFSRAVLYNTNVPTPLEDAVANMKVIDALVQSAHENRWV